MLCKLDRRLSAELYNNAVRLFSSNKRIYIFKCKRIEVKSVACVKVGRYGFGIVIADNCLISHLLERPYAVNRAVVELYTLSYSYRTRAEYYYLLFICRVLFYKFGSLVFFVKSAVEVGRFSRELSGTGINHLIYRMACLYALVSQLLT